MKILVACEESQAVTKELRKLGHDAFSCDLLGCSGGRPDWHFKTNVFQVIKEKGGRLENGNIIDDGKPWEMMIAHPPCTYLAVSGARWMYDPDDSHLPISKRREHPRFPGRRQKQKDAIDFINQLWDSGIPKIAIENPVGVLSTKWGEKGKKPNQIVQPYQFGDEASKKTCLWLKNLPNLKETNVVGKGDMVTLKSGRKLPKWYSDALTKAKTPDERRTLRSKTFQGFARAMAEQWAGNLTANSK
jgi:hypothetical protein